MFFLNHRESSRAHMKSKQWSGLEPRQKKENKFCFTETLIQYIQWNFPSCPLFLPLPLLTVTLHNLNFSLAMHSSCSLTILMQICEWIKNDSWMNWEMTLLCWWCLLPCNLNVHKQLHVQHHLTWPILKQLVLTKHSDDSLQTTDYEASYYLGF